MKKYVLPIVSIVLFLLFVSSILSLKIEDILIGIFIFLIPSILLLVLFIKESKKIKINDKNKVDVEATKEKIKKDTIKIFECIVEKLDLSHSNIYGCANSYFEDKTFNNKDKFGGNSNDDMIDNPDVKYYQYQDINFSAEIIGNENEQRWEIYMISAIGNKNYIANIPSKFNDIIENIIDKSNSIRGNINLIGGYYKCYSSQDKKIKEDKDKLEIKLNIFYS